MWKVGLDFVHFGGHLEKRANIRDFQKFSTFPIIQILCLPVIPQYLQHVICAKYFMFMCLASKSNTPTKLSNTPNITSDTLTQNNSEQVRTTSKT